MGFGGGRKGKWSGDWDGSRHGSERGGAAQPWVKSITTPPIVTPVPNSERRLIRSPSTKKASGRMKIGSVELRVLATATSRCFNATSESQKPPKVTTRTE